MSLKLKDFDYIYKFIEEEIEQGACLVEGVKSTISELLEFHLEANDDNFLSFIFMTIVKSIRLPTYNRWSACKVRFSLIKFIDSKNF